MTTQYDNELRAVPHVVIYGAATALPPGFDLGTRRTPGRQLRLLRDLYMAKMGSARFLRYESYVSDRSVNMGDLAIADAVHGFVNELLGSQIRVTRVDWGQPLPDGHIDWLLVSGSGYLSLDERGQLPDRVIKDTETWQIRKIPYVFVGVGINQLLSSAGKELTIALESKQVLQRVLDRSCGVSVRDSATQQALVPLTHHPVALIGDPALHWAQMFTGQIEPLPRPSQKPQLGINFPMHGRDSARRLREQFPTYVSFLRQLQRRLDCDFQFISHFECSTVLPQLFSMQGLPMKVAYGPPPVLAQTYQLLDMHLGGKLHSCILASSFGVPNVGLAYDRKHFGFFELMGGAEHCLAAEPLPTEELMELLPAVLEDRQSIRERLLTRQESLKKLTMRFLAEALRLPTTAAQPVHP
jgi:polysaccharide pyruvyl transferase WcaK-like protein